MHLLGFKGTDLKDGDFLIDSTVREMERCEAVGWSYVQFTWLKAGGWFIFPLFCILFAKSLYSFVCFFQSQTNCMETLVMTWMVQDMSRVLWNPKVYKSLLIDAVLNCNSIPLVTPFHTPFLYGNDQREWEHASCGQIFRDFIVLPVACIYITEIVCCIARNKIWRRL